MDIINKILWPISVSLILINSIYYSVKLKFPQFKYKKIIQSIIKNPKKSDISPIDTLIMALSSKIGVGCLSGVAIAIYYGGLGTVFWMWISTFFLSIITYLENSLSIIYKEKDKSGPAYYIKKGLNKKNLSIIYAITIILAYTVLFPAIQNNTITTLSTQMYNINKEILSLTITISVSLIILKGIKTISKICNKTFPIMMGIYILIGIIVIVTNINKIPLLLSNIIKEALTHKSMIGGGIYTVILSLQKSIFANESGVGTSAIISGATSSKDYKLQGNIGIIQTYFINFITLTITAIIIGTSSYKALTPINGIELTKYAFSYHLGVLGEYILIAILFLFSFSTLITIYYYGESNLKFLSNNKKLITILKAITITSIFIGGIIKADIIWNLIDIVIAILTIINMYSIYKLKDEIIQKLTRK